MSIESILKHILDEADAQKDKTIEQARLEAEEITRQSRLEAEQFYGDALKKEAAALKKQKEQLLINARLEQKKALLAVKQELIDTVFEKLKGRIGKDKLKKEVVSADKVTEGAEDIDFYLKNLRPDYEYEIARILFE